MIITFVGKVSVIVTVNLRLFYFGLFTVMYLPVPAAALGEATLQKYGYGTSAPEVYVNESSDSF